MRDLKRNPGLFSIVLWVVSLTAIDRFVGVRYSIERWHMGAWHYGVALFNAVFCPIVSAYATVLWVRSRRVNPNTAH